MCEQRGTEVTATEIQIQTQNIQTHNIRLGMTKWFATLEQTGPKRNTMDEGSNSQQKSGALIKI